MDFHLYVVTPENSEILDVYRRLKAFIRYFAFVLKLIKNGLRSSLVFLK